MAAKHWRQSNIDLIDKYANLEMDIMNAPMHYFGDHDHCQEYFCKKQTEAGAESVVTILKQTGLYYEIMDMCQSYFANNVKSLIAGYSTNKTEGFNSLIAKNIGNNFYSTLCFPRHPNSMVFSFLNIVALMTKRRTPMQTNFLRPIISVPFCQYSQDFSNSIIKVQS